MKAHWASSFGGLQGCSPIRVVPPRSMRVQSLSPYCALSLCSGSDGNRRQEHPAVHRSGQLELASDPQAAARSWRDDHAAGLPWIPSASPRRSSRPAAASRHADHVGSSTAVWLQPQRSIEPSRTASYVTGTHNVKAGFTLMHSWRYTAQEGKRLGEPPAAQPAAVPDHPVRHADSVPAWTLDEGADLAVQLHMISSGAGETVRPSIGLYFSTTPPVRTPIASSSNRK